MRAWCASPVPGGTHAGSVPPVTGSSMPNTARPTRWPADSSGSTARAAAYADSDAPDGVPACAVASLASRASTASTTAAARRSR